MHCGHTCLVFESLQMNLREVLRKYGVGRGISMQGVRLYARQLLFALHLMAKCNLVHADLKPDNILINAEKTRVKVCDFGSASFAEADCDITPYLVSRFYRAPEIILGLPYDRAIDMWSLGCCLYELYTGKVAFPGRTNNEMLRFFQEMRGAVPSRMVRRAQFRSLHFTDDCKFRQAEYNNVNRTEITKIVTFTNKPKVELKDLILRAAETDEQKTAVLLADLLDKMFTLEPVKRVTVSEALQHPFFTTR